MVPSCATAGDPKIMSPVAYDHFRDPSCATSYTLPSCEPNSTDPSSAMAGDDTIGPPVWNAHHTAGFRAGRTKGERPRCAGPSRNIACAASTAYCGSGIVAGGAATTGGSLGRPGSCGHTQAPASQMRSALQSLSDPHGPGGTCAQPEEPTAPRAQSTGTTRTTGARGK